MISVLVTLAVALPLFGAMVIVTLRASKGDTYALFALGLLAVVWLRVNKSFEGPVVIRLTSDHGLVASDLVAIVLVLAGLLGWARHRRGAVAEVGQRQD